jgi:hypothetical protein
LGEREKLHKPIPYTGVLALSVANVGAVIEVYGSDLGGDIDHGHVGRNDVKIDVLYIKNNNGKTK